jgi:hypothetical protein
MRGLEMTPDIENRHREAQRAAAIQSVRQLLNRPAPTTDKWGKQRGDIANKAHILRASRLKKRLMRGFITVCAMPNPHS